MRVLEASFGSYPYSSIGAIVVSGHVDAMEAASRPTYPGLRWAQHGNDFEQTVAHEIAHLWPHLWLGNTVSFRSWRDIWLSEGFATYGELLWVAHKRNVPIGLLFRRHSCAFAYVPSMEKVPPGRPRPSRIFNSSVYNRGALTLEALRRTVGDDGFNQIMRTWVAENQGRNVTTADFIALAERISGRPLDQFFKKWLYRKKMPRLPKQSKAERAQERAGERDQAPGNTPRGDRDQRPLGRADDRIPAPTSDKNERPSTRR